MDSLTQIVLGAAVGEVILGKQLGNKAMLLGAVAGTIPDLDVIYNFFDDDPVKQLIIHRGYSHALFTHILLSFPLAWISRRLGRKEIAFNKWYFFWFAGLFTHALLDCCTTYGTKLFLPFTYYQVAFNNISVIDPLYTVPFLILLMICLFFKRTHSLRRKFLWASVTVSSAYMLITFILKYNVGEKFRKSLLEANITYDELNTTPTILNAILWSAIAQNDSLIYCGEYSFLKPGLPVSWIAYKRNLNTMRNFDSEALRIATWFSDGNYFVQPHGTDSLTFFNIKWGRTRFDVTKPEDAFLFYMHFYKQNGEVKYKQIEPDDWNFNKAFQMLLDRIGL